MTGKSENDKRAIPRIINDWWLMECLGSGYSGKLQGSTFRAQHVHTKYEAAIKLQAVDHECPTNRIEQCLYPSLQGLKGIPTLLASGICGEWTYLVLDLLGPSLHSLYRKYRKVAMDLGTVCSIAMQAIARIAAIHARGILHRDIQLGNFVVGLPPNHHIIYVIDLGFSKRYINPHTRSHIPDSNVKRDFIGNYWFSSVNVHCRGTVPSRRDDLEAIALMLIHLLTPYGLSWTRRGVPKTDEAHDALKLQKKSALPEHLCRNMPVEFEDFLRYCRRLQFYEKPDYDVWIEKFRDLAVAQGYPSSEDFVWPPRKQLVHMRPVQRLPGLGTNDNLQGILEGLRKLNLQDPFRPALGDRTNRAQSEIGNGVPAKKSPIEVMEISDSSDGSKPQGSRTISKQGRLKDLVSQLHQAKDQDALSSCVRDFIEALQCNSSRTLTMEASVFLDHLCQRLAALSRIPGPGRVLRSRSQKADATESRYARRVLTARLKTDIRTATDAQAIINMIVEFGTITNNSHPRTITKDGFTFLQGLSDQLKLVR